VRHPLYSGLLLAAVGLAGVTHNEERLALVPVLFVVLQLKVAFEEKCLVEKYGAEYTEYQDKVDKRLIPFIW